MHVVASLLLEKEDEAGFRHWDFPIVGPHVLF